MTLTHTPQGTVLLVDDELDILESLRSFLGYTMPGVKVVTAPSAEEAMRALDEVSPDVVVSDLRMPGTDGFEFLQVVRHRNPRSRRILMTAYGANDLEERTQQAGVGIVIRKPFPPDDFCMKLQAALQQ